MVLLPYLRRDCWFATDDDALSLSGRCGAVSYLRLAYTLPRAAVVLANRAFCSSISILLLELCALD